jgi:hypothetical protein
MLAIVRTALRRPYTFVVLAILIFGALAWVKTPTDIFPNIGIPVISVVWTYNGLPPEDMSGRVKCRPDSGRGRRLVDCRPAGREKIVSLVSSGELIAGTF